MTRARLHTLASVFGGVLTVGCLSALASVLAQAGTWSALVEVIAHHWLALAGLVAAYMGLVGLQALAWWRLLVATAGAARAGLSVGIFSLTQLGKYLPGNVGHFVFRYALTRASGTPRAATLAASALEPWLLLIAALTALVALGDVDWPTRWGLSPIWGGLLPVMALIGAAVGVIWVRRQGWVEAIELKRLITPGALQGVFVLASAGLFFGVLALYAPVPMPPVSEVMAAAVLAWWLGFVTPGSPGGLGVREAVMTVALAASIDSATAVAAVAVYRGVTVLGDGLVFLLAAVWWGFKGRHQLAAYRHHLDQAAQTRTAKTWRAPR